MALALALIAWTLLNGPSASAPASSREQAPIILPDQAGYSSTSSGDSGDSALAAAIITDTPVPATATATAAVASTLAATATYPVTAPATEVATAASQPSELPQATQSPVEVGTYTPELSTPTVVSTPSPQKTIFIEATQGSTAAAAKSTAKPVSQPQAAKPTSKPPKPDGTAILPTGAKYGDHNPNVPGRVVRIAAPSIKLDTKVYEVYGINGVWEVAEYAAGHQYSSMNPGDGGNVVLSGHNNWKGEVFRYLENLKSGAEIDLWTQAGTKYVYKVREIDKLKEVGVSYAQRVKNGQVMNNTPREQLTLITCWPYTTYTHRLIVIADPVPNPAP